jgi:hypothetical protein
MSRREFVSDLRDHEGITPGHAAFFFVHTRFSLSLTGEFALPYLARS